MIIKQDDLSNQVTVLKIEADSDFLKLSLIETNYKDHNRKEYSQKTSQIYLRGDDLSNLSKIISAYNKVLK